jgi:hypothetical protein
LTPTDLVLVLALGGATFRGVEPLIAAGRLPNLAVWAEDGVAPPPSPRR